MRFAIDVIFVRRDGRVTKVRAAIPARRLAVSPMAFAVVETAAGGSAGVAPGDYLELAPVNPVAAAQSSTDREDMSEPRGRAAGPFEGIGQKIPSAGT
jgi:hypothetical protein